MKTSCSYFRCRIFLSGLFVAMSLNSCDKPSDDTISGKFYINDLTVNNYPKVDGSTSTEPLEVLIACSLFNIDYTWVYLPNYSWLGYPFHLMPSADSKPETSKFISQNIHHQGTNPSFLNLINKNVDLILSARTASADEIHLADSLEVNLVETPVAIDAFIFLANNHNPVNSLTTKEIQDIYTGNITQWNEVGGSNSKISPYMRERNSGSQELMESLVMKDLQMLDLPDMIQYGMIGLINRIEYDKNGLGYSVYFYTKFMIRSDSIKMLAVDGVYPDHKNIGSRKYIYTADVYAIIREDLDKSSMAYKLFELLQSKSGRDVIDKSGYIPYY